MDDEVVEIPNVDYGQKLEVLSQIVEMFQRNIIPMKRDQETMVKALKNFQDRHREDRKTITSLRSNVKDLTDKLKIMEQDKEIYARKFGESEDRCRGFKTALDDANEQVKAVLCEVREQDASIHRLESQLKSNRSDVDRLQNELRAAEEKATTASEQLLKERTERHAERHDLEQSALVRMEAQKRDIEQRMKEKELSVTAKYHKAHSKMKADFQKSLEATNKEMEKLEKERDYYVAMAQKLVDEMEEFKQRTQDEWQQEAAKNLYKIVTKVSSSDNIPKRPKTPTRPTFLAKRLLNTLHEDGHDITSNSSVDDSQHQPKITRLSSVLPKRINVSAKPVVEKRPSVGSKPSVQVRRVTKK